MGEINILFKVMMIGEIHILPTANTPEFHFSPDEVGD